MGIRQRELLVYLSEEVCTKFVHPVIVNIGVHVGCSMYCLHAGCESATLWGVDIEEKWLTPAMRSIGNALIGNSNVVHEQVPAPIHLLFIDGGHAYGVVKGDIDGWVPKICIGGIVAFHDMHMPGVQMAFTEWCESADWNWAEIPDSPLPGLRAFEKLH